MSHIVDFKVEINEQTGNIVVGKINSVPKLRRFTIWINSNPGKDKKRRKKLLPIKQ